MSDIAQFDLNRSPPIVFGIKTNNVSLKSNKKHKSSSIEKSNKISFNFLLNKYFYLLK
jgi:hypothetical protein